MRFLGQTNFGVYSNDCKGLPVDVIEQLYGVDDGLEKIHQPHQSGARNPIDKEDNGRDEDQAMAAMMFNQEVVTHKAVHVPPPGYPFHQDENEAQFCMVLQEVIRHNIIPDNFGLIKHEWKDGHYPIYKMILVGRHAAKTLHISLAEPIWYD